MSNTLFRTISRFLIVCMLAVPYTANANLIGTDTVVSAQQAGAARDTIRNFVNRAELGSQMQALGLDPATAKDRVNALTDAEAAQLAERINSLPAGADGTALVVLILIGVIIWFFVRRA
jgi:hypothetical protein